MTGRVPRVTGADIVRALERDGWLVDRISGSHHILKHPDRAGRPVVPRHAGQIVKPGTLKDILRDADMSVDRLRSLL
jgi:predicted RNA binding protein YcfA (HicA-like mRNA interferase family)